MTCPNFWNKLLQFQVLGRKWRCVVIAVRRVRGRVRVGSAAGLCGTATAMSRHASPARWPLTPHDDHPTSGEGNSVLQTQCPVRDDGLSLPACQVEVHLRHPWSIPRTSWTVTLPSLSGLGDGCTLFIRYAARGTLHHVRLTPIQQTRDNHTGMLYRDEAH